MPVEATDIHVSLSSRPVLRGVSLALRPGEVTGLLGANGSGKTTLMRTLAGQLTAGTGAVRLDGRPLSAFNARERARHIAFLPQQRVIAWPLSVAHVVALGRMPWHGWRQSLSAAERETCRAALETMQAGDLADRVATELSGGEQARVLMARAIAQDTPVLLADEPAAGLDPAHQILLMTAMRQLAGRGRSVLVSLHELSLAARWCDRLVVLAEGTVQADGPAGDVLTPDLLESAYGITAQIGHDACGPWLAPLGLAPARRGD